MHQVTLLIKVIKFLFNISIIREGPKEIEKGRTGTQSIMYFHESKIMNADRSAKQCRSLSKAILHVKKSLRENENLYCFQEVMLNFEGEKAVLMKF